MPAPVVDEHGRLIGVIDVDNVVHVIDKEAEEDPLKLGGVREDDFYDAVVDTIRSRLSCLPVNLITAIHASRVIGLFDAAIEKAVALAVEGLMTANALRIFEKETPVGSINGFLFAVLVGVWQWRGSAVR